MVPSSFCESPGLRSQWEGIDLYRIGDSGKGRVVDCLPLVASSFQSTSALTWHNTPKWNSACIWWRSRRLYDGGISIERRCIAKSFMSRSIRALEYRLSIGANRVGYASVAMAGPWKDNPTIYQYYVIPQF